GAYTARYSCVPGAAGRTRTFTAGGLLGLDELVVHAGRFDGFAHALAVGRIADEDHPDALHRGGVHLGEGADDDVGHHGGFGGAERYQVALDDATLHG